CELRRDDTAVIADDDSGRIYGVTRGSWQRDPVLLERYRASEASGRYQITSIEQLTANPRDVTELGTILAANDDVWAWFNVNLGAWRYKLQGDTISDYSTTDGAHGVAIVGYRSVGTGKQFLLHNSWGPAWGDHGYAWISEAMVTEHLY